MKKITFIFSILMMSQFISAQIIHVPGDHSNIQAAINASTDGDTILVEEGTYLENINFKGKAITLGSLFIIDADTTHISRTVIDGSDATDSDSASVVYMISGEDSTSVLNGFTITGGKGTSEYVDVVNAYFVTGGGIKMYSGKIVNNLITGNIVESIDYRVAGGGIMGATMEPELHAVIRNNQIYNNHTISNGYAMGAGMALAYSSGYALVEENQVYKNTATSRNNIGAIGGGVMLPTDSIWSETMIFRNNIIDQNEVRGGDCQGGGIYIEILSFSRYRAKPSNFFIYNNVISNNISDAKGGGIAVFDVNTVTGGYSHPGPVIFNNTIKGNKAFQGSGIHNHHSRMLLFNNIIWNDLSADGCTEVFNDDNSIGYIETLYNIIQGGYEGLGNIDRDPLFEADTILLSLNSPAIGRSMDSVKIAGTWYLAPEFDLFGADRKMASADNELDLGAVESSHDRPRVVHDSPSIINVPDEESSIQAGIDAAATGDTVLVDEGVYFENINFKGKAITVTSDYLFNNDPVSRSQTIIDGSKPLNADSASVVMMVSGEDTTSILKGFTITGGRGTTEDAGGSGGGVLMNFSGGIIEHNIIEKNHVKYDGAMGWGLGGGISAATNNDRIAIIRYNTIAENTINSAVYANGGGISLGGSNFVIEHNKIYKNTCNSQSNVSYGGGIGWWSFDPPGYDPHVKIGNNEIYSNSVVSEMADQHTTGGGMRLISTVSQSEVDVYNNLIYDNFSEGSGGGIAFYGTNDAVCRNNTIYDNRVGSNGKSIYQNGGSVIFFNNIVSTSLQNKDEIVLYNNAGNPKLHAHYNLIKGGWEGNSNFIGDTDFMDESFELSESSLCIDRGVKSVEVNGVTYFAPSLDMAGSIRPFTGNDYTGVDLGAVESEFLLVDYFDMTTEQLDNGGACKVTLSIFAEGGVPPYTYYIDDVEQSGNIIKNLCGGEYKVSIIDALGNEVSEDPVIIDGISEKIADHDGLKIYPNPAKDILTIETSAPGRETVEIMTVNGQLILSSTIEGNILKIDLSQWTEGIYVLMVRSMDAVYTGKIIKY